MEQGSGILTAGRLPKCLPSHAAILASLLASFASDSAAMVPMPVNLFFLTQQLAFPAGNA